MKILWVDTLVYDVFFNNKLWRNIRGIFDQLSVLQLQRNACATKLKRSRRIGQWEREFVWSYNFQFAKRNDLRDNFILGMISASNSFGQMFKWKQPSSLSFARIWESFPSQDDVVRAKVHPPEYLRDEKNPGPKVKRLEIFLRSLAPTQFLSNDNKWACSTGRSSVFLRKSQRGLWLMFICFRLCEFCLAGIRREKLLIIAENGILWITSIMWRMMERNIRFRSDISYLWYKI